MYNKQAVKPSADYLAGPPGKRQRGNGEMNKLSPEDRAVHDWYRFVLSYPPHLVRTYLERFSIGEHGIVLDPFCGTGTTLVECKKQGIPSVGIEAHPMSHFASRVKVDWSVDPGALLQHAQHIAEKAHARLHSDGIRDDYELLLCESAPEYRGISTLRSLDSALEQLLLKDSLSPRPLHKVLVLLEVMAEETSSECSRYEQLALAKALVFSISNLNFGPEVGVGRIKADSLVIAPWLCAVQAMANDLRECRSRAYVPARTYHADARRVADFLPPQSISAIITSPPYPNEKDYTRTTRLESVLLGFIHNKAELQVVKKGLVRSNTRSVYKGDDDDQWVAHHPEVARIARDIEERRVALGKTSGFERMYPRVTKLYFGGMARHFADLRAVLKPGAHLAYVVGDQASYLRVMIRTGQLLADIAQSLGYEVVGIDLFRTRLATATKEQLREEVVVLRWPG